MLTCHKSGFIFNLSHSFLLCNKRLFKAEIAIVRYIIHGWIHVGHWLNGVQFLCINGKSPTAFVRDEVDFKKGKPCSLERSLISWSPLLHSPSLSWCPDEYFRRNVCFYSHNSCWLGCSSWSYSSSMKNCVAWLHQNTSSKHTIKFPGESLLSSFQPPKIPD